MRVPGLQGPFHFVGIGGSGMSPLAEILRAQGEVVSGSDEKGSETTARLAARGVRVFLGHHAANVTRAGCVVVSSAIRESNPELVESRSLGLHVIHRGDLLNAVMSSYPHRIAIAGSHGKTTTTAMIIGILEAAGFDPMALVGGKLRGIESGARLGAGTSFVAEADESDRSFLKLHPTIALVTNVDREHLDTYADMRDVEAAFAEFARSVPAYGRAVLCAEDPIALGLAAQIPGRALTYGFGPTCDVTGAFVMNGEAFPRLNGRGPLGEFEYLLGVVGEMNALNSLGAMAVAQSLGISPAIAGRALSSFRGVARRLEWKGRKNGVDVWDDYGHHPTEICATLKALRTRNPGRRLVTLFQPHRISRTRSLWNEFTGAFSQSDELWLSSIYAAGEPPEEGVTAERLVEAISATGRNARFAGRLDEASSTVIPQLRENDVFLTLGAGNVVEVGESFLSGTGASA